MILVVCCENLFYLCSKNMKVNAGTKWNLAQGSEFDPLSVIEPLSWNEEVNAATTNQLVEKVLGVPFFVVHILDILPTIPKNECLKIKTSSATNRLEIEGFLFSLLHVHSGYSTFNPKIWKSFQLCSQRSRSQCCNKSADNERFWVLRTLLFVVDILPRDKYIRTNLMQVSAVTNLKPTKGSGSTIVRSSM